MTWEFWLFVIALAIDIILTLILIHLQNKITAIDQKLEMASLDIKDAQNALDDAEKNMPPPVVPI